MRFSADSTSLTTRIRRAAPVVSAILIVLALAGCTAPGQDPASLEGEWKLEAFSGSTGLLPTDGSIQSTLTLEDGQASGNGGVNSFSGTYEASAGKISFGPLAATEMAGPPEAMEQEQNFFAALAETRGFETTEGRLVLSNADNDTVMVLVSK